MHRRYKFLDFEIEFLTSLRYKERESSRIFAHSHFEQDEFEVLAL